MNPPQSRPRVLKSATSFLEGGGDMGERIRAFAWHDTSLGPPASWSPTLKAMVRMLLTTRHPIFIFWGREHIGIYNDSYRASLGPEKHPSILGMPGRQAWDEIWPIIGPQIDMVMAGEGATWHENALVPILRRGRLEDVYWTYSFGPIDEPAADHGVGGVLVICTETTQQVLAERHQAAERQRFEALFAQAPSFIAVLSGPDHVYEMANPGYLRLVGDRPLIGKTVAEALPEVVGQGYIRILDNVYQRGEAFSAQGAKVALRRADGTAEPRFIDFVYQPMRDASGAVTGIFVEGIDVTERHAAEQRLQQAEERLNFAMESSSLGTFEVDLERGTVSFSARASAIFGLEHGETTLHECLMRIPEEDRAIVESTIAEARANTSDGRYVVRHRVVWRDGSTHWVSVAGRATRDEASPSAPRERLAGILWDVTEQQQLLQSLQRSDRLKDRFLATLSHELRNPLAPIRTAAHLLARPDLSAENIAECAGLIQRQSRIMALLLDDLLELARITSGKMVLRKVRVDVGTVVASATEAARPAIDAKSHHLTVTVHDEPLEIVADSLRLSQVLMNLLTNAAKYTDPGGRISLDARRGDGVVVFEVKDNGIGLAPEIRPGLFEMFHQGNDSLDRAQGGLGIGLALSKGLIDLHGGTIEAESEGAGHGSIFRVTLPIRGVEAAAPEVADPAHEVAASNARALRVLVVDDNRDIASSMEMMLELEGYQIALAYDGVQALDVADKFRPDAAFVDIGMPRLDGYQVARRMRQAPWGRDILLVATTGWGQEDDKDRATSAGFDLHLTKPVSPITVMKLLEERFRDLARD